MKAGPCDGTFPVLWADLQFMGVGSTCPKLREGRVKVRGVLSDSDIFFAARQYVESGGVSNEAGPL